MSPYRTLAAPPDAPSRSLRDRVLDTIARHWTENPKARSRLGGHWERPRHRHRDPMYPYFHHTYGPWKQVPVCTLVTMRTPCSNCHPPEEFGCTLMCHYIQCEDHGVLVHPVCPTSKP